MPLVKTHLTGFRQKDGKKFSMRVYCSQAGTFTIKVPDEVADALGFTNVSASTMKEATREFNRALGAFEAMQQERKKVIVYKIQSNSYIFDKDICVSKTDDISFCAGTAIAMACGVYELTITNASGRQIHRYRRQESTIPHGLQCLGNLLMGPQDNEMDWTPEREEFFRRIGESLESLIVRLTEVCGNRDSLIKLADSLAPLKFLANA